MENSMNLREILKEEKKKNKILKSINEEFQEFIIFTIKNRWFAIELDSIVEIEEVKNYINFPIAPTYIKGLQLVHGNAVILFDILEILENNNIFNSKNIEGSPIIILKHNEDFFGIIITDLIETISFPKNKISFAPELEEFYRGTFKYKDKVVLLLDIDKIIGHTYDLRIKNEKN